MSGLSFRLLGKRSSSPDISENASPKRQKLCNVGKLWKGTTSSEFQPELLEEMGVRMLPGVSEEVMLTNLFYV